MNVCLLPSAFYPHRGGVEELTLQLARQLTAVGHHVRVVAPQYPDDLPAHDRVEEIEVARVRFPSPQLRLAPMAEFSRRLVTSVQTIRRLRPRPDVLHVQCPSNQLPVAAVAARLLRAPLVLTTQGETEMDAAQIFQRSAYMRSALRLGAGSAAQLTACSTWAARCAARIAPRFAHACVIPNGIDPGQWVIAPIPDAPVVAAWGRHVPQKGFDLLLDAWPQVLEALPRATLLIGGDGPETAGLRARTVDSVEFVGPLDRAGVQRLLSRARVAVVPSKIEPFGIVALEAMACGRSVVWSARGGLSEATGGRGWSADPFDPRALASALIEALRAPLDPVSNRRWAESLSWSRIADEYINVYRAVCGKTAKT